MTIFEWNLTFYKSELSIYHIIKPKSENKSTIYPCNTQNTLYYNVLQARNIYFYHV